MHATTMHIQTPSKWAIAAALTLGACSSSEPEALRPPDGAAAPRAAVRPVTDDYFGTKVVDPYRYMEELANPEVQSWLKSEDDSTRRVLATIPGRQKLFERILELHESTPVTVALSRRLPGDRYLCLKLLATDDFPKLYWRQGLDGPDRLLVDPQSIRLAAPSQSKGRNSLSCVAPSDDARYLLVGILPGGAEDAAELHVLDVETGRETGDVVTHASAQLAEPCWLPRRHAFVYARLRDLPPDAPAAEVQQKSQAFLHEVGSDVARDPAVFGWNAVPSIAVDPKHFGSVRTQPDSNWALGVVETGVSPNLQFFVEPVDALSTSQPQWRRVADDPDDVADCVVHGDDLYLLTFKDAPHYEVVRTNAREPDLARAKTILPAGAAVVREIRAAQDALYVRLTDGGASRLLRVSYDPEPKIESVALPFAGSIEGITADPRVAGIAFDLVSWTRSGGIYTFDPATGAVADTKLQPIGRFDDAVDLEESEVEVRSHDGTLVPLSIIHRKGIALDGSNPTLLHGYGSYGTTVAPFFFRPELAWLERGGVIAVAHVRGGGERGEEWHLAGKGATKPNTWLDFIACGEYLVAQRYTSPARLTCQGGSAGGILVGRSITERPDLFAAAVIDVGLLDTLRAETTSNGVPNIPEFGSTKTKEGFDALLAMSSYHHVRDGTRYPAVLLTTGINDPRVEPWEPAKMTARLQAATASGKPVLLRVDYGGGHGSGSGMHAMQETLADRWSFLLWQTGATDFQPGRARS